MKQVSRQRLWQIRQNEKGLCAICTRPLHPSSNHFCTAHHEYRLHEYRLGYARRIYRKDHNIPDGESKLIRGRPRIEEPEWKTPEFYRMLGKATDVKIASIFKVSPVTVRKYRTKLNIPRFKKGKQKHV